MQGRTTRVLLGDLSSTHPAQTQCRHLGKVRGTSRLSPKHVKGSKQQLHIAPVGGQQMTCAHPPAWNTFLSDKGRATKIPRFQDPKIPMIRDGQDPKIPNSVWALGLTDFTAITDASPPPPPPPFGTHASATYANAY